MNKQTEYQRQYYIKNRAQILARNKQHYVDNYKNNPDYRKRRIAAAIKWNTANVKKARANEKAYKQRRRTDDGKHQIDLERSRRYVKAWRSRNRELVLQKEREYSAANREKRRFACRKWQHANLEKTRARNARRRAAELNATPKWLSIEHEKEILSIYTEAVISELQVDHIVPLQSNLVCGLHVPWNLQLLSKTENVRKTNHVIE